MPRKGGSNAGDGVSPRQFCCGCICLLGSVLFLQICLLANLLRRLSDVHRAADALPTALPRLPPVRTAAVPAAKTIAPAVASMANSASPQSSANAAAPWSPQSAELPVINDNLESAPLASKLGLAMGAAFGLGADTVLIFLASLQKVSPQCDIVLFTDKEFPVSDMKAVGIDEQRVHFETIPQAGLPDPWNRYHMSSTRWWLYKSYLARKKVPSEYRFVQLSDVGDVAFQSDPFAWAQLQANGLHVFLDEPGTSISSEQQVLAPLMSCYGDKVSEPMQQQTVLTHGYLIGSARVVEDYVHKMVMEIVDHGSCQKAGVDGAVYNMLLRRPSGLAPHMHENRQGPVWTGQHVPHRALRLDESQNVLNEDGYPYVVLHQYDWHENLWRSIADRFLGERKKQLASLDCSQFDVAPGDLKGFDLSHTPADSQKDCCVACLGDPGCGAFVFKPSAKHCWLKRPGITNRLVPGMGNDVVAGITRSQMAR
mmetsp:Transcript_47125/g.88265  ORF Transcript_47125/g.88265 Transcript_47125/m.88265 type:complete len:482 (+) Transcript_47125:139-1584(+)